MKTIYLIRHGQTDFNKSGIVQGSGINASLNNTGIQQSDCFYQAYKDIPFDIVYTSELKRSIESVQQFIDLGIPWKKEIGFNEISWGDYDGKKITNDDYYWEVVRRWHEGETNLKTNNGESPQDVIDRAVPVLNKIIKSQEDTILICMHGRAMRILLTHIAGYSLHKMDKFPHHNLGFYKITHDENGFKIIEENNTKHLHQELINHPKT